MADKVSEATPSSAQDPELPTYSGGSVSQTDDVEHRYQLQNSKGKEWLWLTVKSHSKSTQHLPLFFDRDRVGGTVEIDFDKADGAKAVSISLTAGVTAVGQEEIPFLKSVQELWDGKTSSSRAQGRSSWPFSIEFPDKAPERLTTKPGSPTYSLPPTFTERASPAYIDYKLTVTVRRGMLKVKQTLSTSLIYLPIIRAGPPSHLRQLAYNDGTALLGPEGDPDGWQVLPPIRITGTIFNARQVQVFCTLAFARPLSVAIGSPLPVFLTLTGTDQQALDVLATPSAPRVRLLRIRAIGSHALDENESGRSDNTFRDHIATAGFWPNNEGAPEENRRTLQGELAIHKSVKPSFTFPNFALRYSLVMYPFQASGFTPSEASTEALLSERLVITSANAPGVVSRSYAPPGYVPPEGDYNIATGYLENGNQRFLHHGGGHGGFQ